MCDEKKRAFLLICEIFLLTLHAELLTRQKSFMLLDYAKETLFPVLDAASGSIRKCRHHHRHLSRRQTVRGHQLP